MGPARATRSASSRSSTFLRRVRLAEERTSNAGVHKHPVFHRASSLAREGGLAEFQGFQALPICFEFDLARNALQVAQARQAQELSCRLAYGFCIILELGHL